MKIIMDNGCKRWTALFLALVLCLFSVMSVSAADEDAQSEIALIVEDSDAAEDSAAEADVLIDETQTESAESAAGENESELVAEENESEPANTDSQPAASSLVIESVEEVSSDEAAAASPDSTGDDTGAVIEEFTYINPLYEGIIDESDLNQPQDLADVPSVASDDVEYLDTVDEAAAEVREAMVNRQETVVVYYQMETYDSTIAKSIVTAALEHTGVADEGDYISANYGGSSYTISRSSSGGIYYLTITCTMTYYTTYEQEAAVTSALNTVMAGLDLDSKTDYEKISAIYEYICKNVTYDYDNLEDTSYMLKYSAYAALINGTSVCQGYAALLYRMMLMAGIDARLISGTGNGGGHAWNIVQLGDDYYNVDATWDATATRTALVPLSYKYYLRCSDNFGDHTRDDEYLTDEFNASYPMSGADYQLSEEEASVILLSGTCGDGLTWEVSQGGTLTISGTGAIPDYDNTDDVPWTAARSGITEIVLEEGVTGIGIFAFCYFSALPAITLPDSLTTIDQYAFGYCTSLTELFIPSGVTTISYNAFTGCTALASITFDGDAPTIRSSSFTDVTATAYYPSNYDTWTDDSLQDYGGTITWEGYTKHTYGEPEFTWADDFSTCTATFTCTDTDCGETFAAACTVTSQTTDATCTEDGATVYTAVAKLNNKEYSETETVTIAATGHSYDDGEVTTAATCTEDGVLTYTCASCGDTYTEVIAATGHTEETDAAVAATCTETGLTAGSHCSVCGEVLTEQEEIPATGHAYDEGVVTTEPTCTEAGVMTYTCETCGDTYMEAITATGHTEVADAAVAATCTETGLSEGSHCSVCGEILTAQEVIDALGHSYVSEVTTAATCTEDGVKTYTCETCGDTYTEAITATGHNHDEDEGEVTIAATCTEAGVMTYTCTVCGDTYTDVIAATGHIAETDAAVEATCTETGLTAGSHCSVCGEILVAQKVVAATGHTVVTDAAVASTCTETGLTAGSHCSVCGEVLAGQEEIAALGHSYDNGTVTKEPTTTEEGVRTYTCETCGATYTESVEKLSDTSDEGDTSTGGSETSGTTGTYATDETNSAGGSSETGETNSTGETDATGETNSAGGAGETDGTNSTDGTDGTDTDAGSSSDTGTVSATGLQISRSTISLKVKGTAKIGVIVSPANTTDEVTYTSSKPSVVKVSASGKITAKKAGTAKITVWAGEVTKTITIKVVKKR